MNGQSQASGHSNGTEGDDNLESVLTWRKSIFTRLMLTFALIVSPLFLAAFFIYNWGIGSVKEELERSMRSQVGFFVSNYNTEVQRINALLYNTLYDSNLTDLANRVSELSDYDLSCTYSILESPMGVENYIARLALTPVTDGNRTFCEWQAEFDCPPEREDALVRQIGSGVFQTAFDALKKRFGS